MSVPLMRLLCAWLAFAATAGAQEWRPGDAEPLVVRAALARSARDADTLLAGWQAVASGVVRFVAVVDHGTGSTERVIRADQLRVEVYGEAPNRSKQEIVAWRDTTIAPTDITYHRDHLGIVASDFGPVIRLGEGDEVRDVPHPLSPAGLAHYEFAVADTVSVAGPGAAVRVVAVHVRPRDPSSPGTIGTLFLDAGRAATVRFAFTFTASSYRDPTVAAITVELENAFLDGQRWLPWRQSITIRREGPVLDLPLHTLLRADWAISDYRLGVTHPAGRFRGAPVAGLRQPSDSGWTSPLGEVIAGLPASGRELDAVMAAAGHLAPAARLDGMPALRLLADRGLSSLLRVTRVEGITPGIGARFSLDHTAHLELAAAYGTAADLFTATATLRTDWYGVPVSFAVGRDVMDVADGAFGSGLVNSIATAIAGDDAGSWVLRDRFTAIEVRGTGAALAWSVRGMHEHLVSLSSRFAALDGTMQENPALGIGAARRVIVRLGSRGDGTERGWRIEGELGRGAVDWGRLALAWRGRSGPLAWRLDAGAGSRDLPGYRSFVTGGRGTLVGVPHRSIGGRRIARVEVALPLPVGVPAPGLGRRTTGVLASRVSPFLAAAVAGGGLRGMPWQATGEVEPVLGARLDLWGPLLRVEAGWAIRRGTFGVTLDAHPGWWPML